jgi:hypothetical protein
MNAEIAEKQSVFSAKFRVLGEFAVEAFTLQSQDLAGELRNPG